MATFRLDRTRSWFNNIVVPMVTFRFDIVRSWFNYFLLKNYYQNRKFCYQVINMKCCNALDI